MATEWQILDRVWDLPDRNKIKSDALRKVLRELHTGSGGAGFQVLPGPVSMTQPLVVDEGRTVVVEGDLSIGTSGTPLTVDQTHLTVKESGMLVVLGNVEIHRNVSATTRLVDIVAGKMQCTGTFTTSHVGGGDNEGVTVGYGSEVDVGGATTIASDAVTAVWSVGLYIFGSEAIFRGGLTATMTGSSVYPVYIAHSKVTVGDDYWVAGNLVVTSGATTGNNYASLYLARGVKLTVWGDTTVTTDSVPTNETALMVRNDSTFQCAGDVAFSMASNDCLGAAALLWVRHGIFNMTGGTKTLSLAAGTLGASSIYCEEHGQIAVHGTLDGKESGLIRAIEQSEVLLGGGGNLGTGASPIAVDLPAIQLESGASVVVTGNLEVYRDVSATSELLDTKDGKLSVSGTLDVTHAGAGDNVAALLEDGANVVVGGLTTITTDATGAASAALQGNVKADAAFKGGLTIVATGADVRPIYVAGDVEVVVGDTILATGNLTVTRSGSGNVWTQNSFANGSKLTVGGDIVITANAITVNEVPLFFDASDLVCTGDVTITATSLADGGLQLYNGATFKNSHNLKTLSITLGSTAVEAIKVMRKSSFTMANDVILEGTAAAVMIDDGSEMNVSGDLLLGNTTEQPGDMTCLSVLDGGEVTVGGALTVKRDVAAATALMHVRAGEVNVGGVFTQVHSGGGTGYGIWMASSGEINVEGAASVTSDITSGSWAVVIYASNGGSALRWRGGLTVSCTGANVRPISVTDCDFLMGNPETVTGALAITHTGTAVQGWGVATFTKGVFYCVGDCTVTANNIVTGGGGLLVRQGHWQVGGELSVSMTSKTDGKLLWILHRCHMSVYDIGTITPSASATAASIQIEENGHFEAQRNDDFLGNGGTLRMAQQSSCYFNSPSFGTSGSPVTVDLPCIDIDDTSRMYTEGAVACYRNVTATTPLVKLRGNAKVDIDGDFDLSRLGVGAGGVLDLDEGAYIKVTGTTDLLAHGGAIAADGSFLRASKLSKAIFNQVLFATGGDLDLDAFASVLVESGSKLVVTDAAGASDARNSDDAAGALGIKLNGGSQAHLPGWAQNVGICVTGAGSAEDYECGGLAAADYTGSETITDIGAGTPELCLLSKP